MSDEFDALDGEPRRPFRPPRDLSAAEKLRAFTIAAELDPEHVLCPVCASAYVLDNLAGRTYGVCEACYRRAKRDAAREELRQLEAGREYDLARQELHRARKAAGVPGKPPKGKQSRRKPLL